MADGLPIIVVLQTHISGASALLRVSPFRHLLAIDADCIGLPTTGDFVIVPLADWFGVRLDRCPEWINRAGAPGRVFGRWVPDLHFVSFVNCYPGIIARVRKPQENAGISNPLFLHEFPAQHEISELPSGKPPQTHSPLACCNPVCHHEPPGPALAPLFQVLIREERDEW